MVEDIHVVESKALQALIQARNQIFPASPVAVRSRPHIVTGFRTDDQFIPISRKLVPQNQTQILLCAPRLRAVIIGQVKMSNAMVKSGKAELFHIFIRSCISKIVPEA